jgi:hypothetical protein
MDADLRKNYLFAGSDSEHLGNREQVERAFVEFAGRSLLPKLLERLDGAAVTKKLPLDAFDGFLPALFDIAETLPDQIGFGQMPSSPHGARRPGILEVKETLRFKRSLIRVSGMIRESRALCVRAVRPVLGRSHLDAAKGVGGFREILVEADEGLTAFRLGQMQAIRKVHALPYPA